MFLIRHRRQRCAAPEWDGVARHHDGTPIDTVKRRVLDFDMEVFDHLPKRIRDQLNEHGGIALEHRPPMTGMMR